MAVVPCDSTWRTENTQKISGLAPKKSHIKIVATYVADHDVFLYIADKSDVATNVAAILASHLRR